MGVVLVAGLLSLCPALSLAIGPYEDVSGYSAFLRASRQPGLSGAITRADSPGATASFLTIAGSFPIRSAWLMQLETSLVSLQRDGPVLEKFADILLRLKGSVWKGEGRSLVLVPSVRLETGSADLFPYATGSTAIGMSLAFVDSVGAFRPRARAGSFAWWLSVGGDYFVRSDDLLDDSKLLGNRASAGAAVSIGLAPSLTLEAGGMGFAFQRGKPRAVCYGRLNTFVSASSTLHAVFQAEAGERQDRAIDASAQLGLTVLY